jgi:DNA-binding response OmpR family regulator
MTKPKILVVDDDQGLQRLLERGLRRAGYTVVTAATGEESVQRVRAEKPGLVLMDIMMPGMDGFEATQRIRQLPEGSDIPIIFLSALGDADAKLAGLDVGADDYVTKPVTVAELLTRIEPHLQSEA